MSEQSMIERVARAIAHGHGAKMTYRPPGGPMQTVASMHGYGHWGDSAERYSHDHWQDYILSAQLALGAMKTPTVAMIDAGYRAYPEAKLIPGILQAMIDEALDRPIEPVSPK